MADIFDFLKRALFGTRKRDLPSSSVEELRTAFKARYQSFKLLLAANNRALRIMADMEHALGGFSIFGASFIRASATAGSVNVFRIIKNLDELAPGRYGELYNRFQDIEAKINGLLAPEEGPKGDRFVVPMRAVGKEMVDLVGDKMANLGEAVNRCGLKAPEGFVISSEAYHRFLAHSDLQAEIDRMIQSSEPERLDHLHRLSTDIQQLIVRTEVPREVEDAVIGAYQELEAAAGPGVRVSLRSSARGEDSPGLSFAGQYRSALNVGPESIIPVYKEILASKYGLTAMSYRLNRGIRDEDIAMSVGVMVMVNAVSGGVMYSVNPLDRRDDAVYISSSWGLPKGIVDGAVDPDLFVVSKETVAIARREIGPKKTRFVCYPEEGVLREEVPGEERVLPSLDDDQVARLARAAVQLEEYYGHPQDIEWAVDPGGTIQILQCRPLMQVEPAGQEFQGPAPEMDDESVILGGGVSASPGAAFGEAFIVRKNVDLLRFPERAVLVASQALPRWAVLVNRAAAVLTEQGSAAGHLANVAREFGIPALFGVPGALDRLETGDPITVDSDGLRVYRGRVESLLKRAAPRKNPMEGSPVYDLLRGVASHIVPLNLLDPDGPDFTPRNCRTLHDITRFCHEKSVHEMFNFGRDHKFSERSSKQLVCDVPMQWWVINLDDGFKEEVEERYVRLENISSIPMLALWGGITAVAWSGPPPVDGRGFMSVLLEATVNPNLEPSMGSDYAVRNYFMISRNFLVLNSRFGFHFSTVESLVGERDEENYISFQFKGGAAGLSRRLRRAHFVARILEEFDFLAEVKEDAVFARAQGQSEEVMVEKLKILGYVIIHTRQLDMIMADDESVASHREKIMGDLLKISRGRTP